jgi:hypothetical protein
VGVKGDLLSGSGSGEPPVLPVQRKDFEFAPLVHSNLHLVADIAITMLVTGEPGQIIRRGGDIDNRLKTLLDALTVPQDNQTPADPPAAGEQLFFCLLKDDKLITALSVQTDRLLVDRANSDHVRMLVHVRTRAVKGTWLNLALGS